MEKTGIQAKFFSANASAIESWRGLCIGIIRYLPLKNGFKPEESSFMLGILVDWAGLYRLHFRNFI